MNLLPNQPDAAERIALIVDKGVKVASFAAAPRPEQVQQLRDAGVVTIVTVGAKRHAQKVAEIGVSAVIAQGGEGGGHTGAIPTSLLVPQVVDGVAGTDVVVLAAGGFSDGRGLAAALAWGADGVAMGTRFLLTQESHVPDHVKDVYLQTPLTGTVVTSAIDGAPQRVIRTAMIDALERSPGLLRFPRAANNARRQRRRRQKFIYFRTHKNPFFSKKSNPKSLLSSRTAISSFNLLFSDCKINASNKPHASNKDRLFFRAVVVN